jgi:hypothetical protein
VPGLRVGLRLAVSTEAAELGAIALEAPAAVALSLPLSSLGQSEGNVRQAQLTYYLLWAEYKADPR